jgi:alpha-ketoglutarate-dependent taurine dioxygenase
LWPDSALVQFQPADAGPGYPAVVTPSIDGVDLATWLAEERAQTRAWLHEYGAVLFRGFDHAASPEAFQTLCAAVIPEPMNYRDRSSPRTEVAQGIYTSTDYPPAYEIAMHSELSYSHAWPRRLAFFCVRPAADGGATPLASTRRVLSELRPETRARFASSGVRYTRRLNPRLGMSWQQVYGTTDRAEVEAHCREAGIEFEWTGDDAMTIQWQRPAICHHPETGEEVWFNHALFFNAASLDADVSLALSAEDAPFETRYGDGAPIRPETLAEIAAAYRRANSEFDWRAGDLLLFDNLLMAHGRRPYRGERSILVAMGS